MKKADGFFDGLKNKVALEVANRSKILEIIKKNSKVELAMEDLNISGGVLRIKSSSAAKNEIFIKKVSILKEINEQVKNIRIKDII